MFRRTLAAVGTSALVAVAVIAPAGAEAPQLDYVAGTSATALEITLAGQSAAFAVSTAGVSDPKDGGPMATADAAGALLVGQALPGAALSQAPDGPATGESCPASLDLGELSMGQLELLGLDIACSRSSSTVENGEPSAKAEAGEVILELQVPSGEVLDTVLAQILTPLVSGLTMLNDALKQPWQMFFGQLPLEIVNLPGLLDVLIDALDQDDFVLAQIVVAPSVSQASASDTAGVVAEAGTSGLVVNLLPGLAASLDELVGLAGSPAESAPLLSVELGNATAQVKLDPVTGAATPDASAVQLLDLQVAPDTIGLLELIAGQAIPQIDGLAFDQLGCNEGNPLAIVLCFEAGVVRDLTADELTARGYDFGPGTVGREATAAKLELLGGARQLLGDAVLGISFAQAEAVANAIVPTAAPAQDPAPAPAGPPLPRTGADSALPLTLGMLCVGAAGAMLLRRTRTSS